MKFNHYILIFLISTFLPFYSISQTEKRFTLLNSNKTGIKFNNKIKDTKVANILMYANFYGGAGVGVGDFNNDGLQDIFFAGNMVANKLYLNEGNFQFKDVTKQAGIFDDGGWSTGVTIVDINNDGFEDIYVTRELHDEKPELRRNLLYLNNQDGTFSEKAKEFGIDNDQRTRHAVFFDYNKDGKLDLFLLTQPPNPGSYSKISRDNLLRPEFSIILYKNIGDKFVDVSKESSVNLTGFPNAVSASDFNNDGWVDLYVANDFYAPDFLLMNNGDGTFTNKLNSSVNHIPYYSMGVDVADINNDMLLDIFTVDMVAEDNFRLKSNMSGMNPNSFWKVVDDGGYYQYMFNTLQLNNGNGTFSDIAQFTGMAATDWSWANLIADFDNDGLKDTYITNGLLHDIRNTDADKKIGHYITDVITNWIKEHPDGAGAEIWDILDLDKAIDILPSQPLQNYAYKNLGDLKFEKIMDEWGFVEKSFSNGAAYADFDNDGDLDIVVNNINETAFLYRNNSEKFSDSNYLQVKLVDENNTSVFGSRVTISTNNASQLIELTNVRGIYSTSETLAHFGTGNIDTIDSLLVTWPDGLKTVKKNIKTNQTLTINKHDSETLAKKNIDDETPKRFQEITSSFAIQHKHNENEYDDYAEQVLLPHKLSQFGPALAIGDINNDHLDDIFIGGATGYEASLYIQSKNGLFNKSSQFLWQKEKVYEDIDALFFDVNNDGFQDLYVVSGGNEYAVNDPHYTDRIYINDNKGNFTKGAILNVENISGSVVKASDYDNDGDLDLFIGGRHLPHQYPIPVSSMLLKNEQGRLENVTNALANELSNLGMVTDAVWSDYDGDGDQDLILVGEWMPITIFINDEGILQKQMVSDLENSTGWWFSIRAGDFDNDGDEDYIAGNIGLNYKYKTTPEKPFDIYYNDFDGNGHYDLVLGYYNGDKHFPVRGFSCSSQQVPVLKTTFQKYDVFASLEIDQVYGEDNLENSLHYKANTFASSYIENLGNGHFKITPLPNLAQLSSINDIIVKDFNTDGFLDALIVGNLFVSEIETTRNDAGTGLLLLGNGKGEFTVERYHETGFFDNQDAKKIKIFKTSNDEVMIIGNNNGIIQFFKVNK